MVLAINGLQPHLRPQKHASQPAPAIVAPYHPGDILRAYGGGSLTQTGAGQTIGIIIDTFPATSDLTKFWQAAGVPQSLSNIEFVQVVGGPLPAPSGEETLDVEWSSSIASGAKVRVYATTDLIFPFLDQAYAQVYHEVSTQAQPGLHQLSLSFGLPEDQVSISQLQTDEQFFAELAAAGVTVFAAAGDNGSPGRVRGGAGPDLESPASSESVTGVGGTSLVLNSSTGAVSSEAVWSGTGGGASAVFPRPAWQVGTGVPAGRTKLVPDVAGPADPNRGGLLVFRGASSQIGGTSLASPMWAGFAALINQARSAAAQPPLGLLGPKIYPLLGTPALRDITTGGTQFLSATKGYDECTGLGVPVLSALISALSNGPVVVSSPAAQTVASGATAQFALVASGMPTLTYQWQRQPAGAGAFSNLTDNATYQGSATAMLTVTATTLGMNGDEFRCLVTNAFGTVTSAPAALTIQAPLPPGTTTINPASASVAAAGVAGLNVTVTSNTTWTVTSLAPWIIPNLTTGSGNGTVILAVAANPLSTPRSGTVSIGNKAFTVTQAGGTASVTTIDPPRVIVSASGASGFIRVMSNTTWSVIPNASWLTVDTASGSGNGRFSLTVAANVALTARTGTVTVGTQTLTVSQEAAPPFATLTPRVLAVAATGSASAAVAVSSNTTWSVSSNVTWIVPGVNAGTGNGSFTLNIGANASPAGRSGTVTVNNEKLVVNQAGSPNFVTITPGSVTVAAAGAGNLTVTVSGNASWTVTGSVPWISFTPSGGFGKGTVRLAVASNPATTSRTGILTIGGQTLSVVQAGAPPTTAISPGRVNVSAAGANGVPVRVLSNTAWTVRANVAWIIPNVTTGTGNGTVLLTIATNPATSPRTGTLAVNQQTLTVSEAGGPAAALQALVLLQRMENAVQSLGAVSSNQLLTWLNAQQDQFLPPDGTSLSLASLPNSAALGVWFSGLDGSTGQNLPAPLTAAQIAAITAHGLTDWWDGTEGPLPAQLDGIIHDFILDPWAITYFGNAKAWFIDLKTGDVYIEALQPDGKTVAATLRLPAGYLQSLGLTIPSGSGAAQH